MNTLQGRLAATGLIPLFRCDNFKYIKSFWIFQISGKKIVGLIGKGFNKLNVDFKILQELHGFGIFEGKLT